MNAKYRLASAFGTVAILAVLLTGCLGDSSPETPGIGRKFPPLGLGLEFPESLPAPGPFVEGEDLLVLELFLREEGSALLAGCGVTDGRRLIDSYIDREYHNGAIKFLLKGCRSDDYEHYARQGMEEGNEKEIFRELREEAKLQQERTMQLLNDHPGPGNPTEAQFMSFLMARSTRDHIKIDRSADRFWEPYENGTKRDDLQLEASYGQFTMARDFSRMVENILERYPWTDPPCTAPDTQEILDRIDNLSNRTLALARSSGHDEEDVETLLSDDNLRIAHVDYTYITNWLLPELENAREHGWWVRLLSLEVKFESWLSYWESFAMPRWPTFEEAEFMVADFRNESRSVFAESIMVDYLPYWDQVRAEGRSDWENEIDPVQMMRFLSLRWPWAGMDCPGKID